MVVRKKNGEIFVLVYFIDLNWESIKDNYQLPNMEILLQHVTGCPLMSMLDGFLGYNQFFVFEEDWPKMDFIAPWGTQSYVWMPFRIKNADATFQRVMDHAFKDIIGKFMVDYQDDLKIHLKLRERHLKHLRQVF